MDVNPRKLKTAISNIFKGKDGSNRRSGRDSTDDELEGVDRRQSPSFEPQPQSSQPFQRHFNRRSHNPLNSHERSVLEERPRPASAEFLSDNNLSSSNHLLEPPHASHDDQSSEDDIEHLRESGNRSPFAHRALPPVPPVNDEPSSESDSEEIRRHRMFDYAASIEKVKDCGWYWGPVSGSSAERILSSEPDGSFIVRDSSNEHYIFSLTVKIDGSVRHVRIEHDQGIFSFGCLHKFKSNTIVDFIEEAVEHSRSGRYLFFLHRTPSMLPMRIQLLHPVSRFKHVQSLQHLCRFVLLKHVRRDLIPLLPLPRKLKNYLNTPYYYSEISTPSVRTSKVRT